MTQTGHSGSLQPGTEIGAFRVVELLGRGGMGEVYRAEQTSLRRPVALKVLSAARLAGEQARSRFLREGALIARLTHPYVVPVYQAGEHDGLLYYAMELVQGADLDAHLATRQPDLRDRLELMIKICEGVQAAHQKGIIHRDLKPGNILVDAEGNPRILDFGLSKIVSDEAPEFSLMTQAGESSARRRTWPRSRPLDSPRRSTHAPTSTRWG